MRKFDIVAPSMPSKENSIGRRSCIEHVSIVRRDQYLTTSYALVRLNFLPVGLTMSIQNALLIAQIAIDVHILAAPLPVDRLVLEVVLETILSPIVHITRIEVNFASDDNVDVSEECEVERRADEVVLIEDNCAPIVAFVKCIEDCRSVVAVFRYPRLHVAVTSGIPSGRVWHRRARVVWIGLHIRTLWQLKVRVRGDYSGANECGE